MEKTSSSEHEKLVAKILALPGLTIQVLQIVTYRLRKRDNLCVQRLCPRQAVEGKVRCELHLKKALETAARMKQKGAV